MRLLTKGYLVENKWLVLFGVVSGIAFSTMLLRWPAEFLAGPSAFFLLNFPYAAKTQVERLLRAALLGLFLSLAIVYGGKTFWPLAWIGFIGSSIAGAIIVCLRYRPPVTEPS